MRPLDVTAALLFPKWAFGEGEADLTVMRVAVEGTRGGKRARYTWDLCDRYDPATDTRSMSRTTGFTASIMARLLLDRRFVRPGVHPPEIPAREPGILDTMLRELAARGVVLHRPRRRRRVNPDRAAAVDQAFVEAVRALERGGRRAPAGSRRAPRARAPG